MQPLSTRSSILNEAGVRASHDLIALADEWFRGTTTHSTPHEVINELRDWLSLLSFSLIEDIALADGKKVLCCDGAGILIDRVEFNALQSGAAGGCATLQVGEWWLSAAARDNLDQQEPFPPLLVHGRYEQVAAFQVESATRVTETFDGIPTKMVEFRLRPWL